MTVRYEKTKSFAGYVVYADDKRRGVIRKVEHWTVRGTRVGWQAYSKSTYMGEAATRNEAAKLLGVA